MFESQVSPVSNFGLSTRYSDFTALSTRRHKAVLLVDAGATTLDENSQHNGEKYASHDANYECVVHVYSPFVS